MTGHRVASHPPLVTPMRDVVALAAFVFGFVLGLLQPLIAVAVGAGIVAGPTYAGLTLALGAVVFAFSFVGAALFRTGRSASVPLALVSAALVAGIVGGSVLEAVLHDPTRSGSPATDVRLSGLPSHPLVLDAPEAVGPRHR
ncbi:MAG TPA: hypothetical protein VFR14_09895 [Candidatus Limnocylindrales bacterium]|nr:hypothetical protein [Candidatus Limnocylindrales bacterium]